MNARTSRLIRRVAFVARQAEPGSSITAKSLKRNWRNTPRPERCRTRHALVGIFNEIVKGLQR